MIEQLLNAVRHHILDTAGVPQVLIPDGHSLASQENLLPSPRHRRSHAQIHDAQGFIEYHRRFAEAGRTIVCATLPTEPAIKAVFDYFAADNDPATNADGHGFHRATYQLRHTPDWERWAQEDGQRMNQAEFAEFLEDNQAAVVAPTGGELLDLVTNFRAATDVRYSSSIRLANGQTQLTYHEEAKGDGSVIMPEIIHLGLPVFIGGDRYEVSARLRTRVRDGQLAIWYTLMRPDRRLEAAYNDVISQLENELDIVIVRGELA